MRCVDLKGWNPKTTDTLDLVGSGPVVRVLLACFVGEVSCLWEVVDARVCTYMQVDAGRCTYLDVQVRIASQTVAEKGS